MVVSILLLLYIVCALTLAIYASSAFLLLFAYHRHRQPLPPPPAATVWPKVVVQLPVYNERAVVERLLEAAAALDYPRDRLTIQLLDDSTDDTSALAAAKIAALRQAGVDAQHIRRGERTGYKAGALAYGLTLTDAAYAAIFDADFVPPPDFLRRTIPYFAADSQIGVVQTRWGHLNPFENALTLAQTLAIDGHFVVEQTARSRSRWPMTFNGSGGVWRVAAIEAAGGWRAVTVTEDLDLSYRAQLGGWRVLFLPQLVVPGEVPAHLPAYKQQQARWAKGNTQCLALLLRPLWRSGLPLLPRVMGTLHLCQYLPSALMVALLLLTPPLAASGALAGLPVGWLLGTASLGAPLIYLTSQRALYHDWPRRLLAFPLLALLGIGLSWNNCRAVVSGLRGAGGEFQRTPKAGGYALPLDSIIWQEAALALYALAGAGLAAARLPAAAPYLLLQAFAFGLVALWSLHDHWLLRQRARLRWAAQRK